MKQPYVDAAYMEDEVTLDFKKRINQGEIIMNGAKSFRSTLLRQGAYGYYYRKRPTGSATVVEQFHARCINGTYTSQFRQPRTAIPDMGSTDRQNELAAFGLTAGAMLPVETRCLNAALERATSSDTLALVTAAELDKTFTLIGSAARSVNSMASLLERLPSAKVRALNQVLKLLKETNDRRRARDVLRALDKGLRSIATTWLGYRYGVMATVYDIQSWARATGSPHRRTRYVVSESTSYEDLGPNTGQVWVVNAALGLYYTKIERRRKTMTRAGVLIGTDALSGADRFGLNRLASTVWELIPFSFVLDWMVDAGQRISAIEGNLLVKPLGTWITHDHNLQYQCNTYWDNKQVTNLSGYDYDTGGVDSSTVIESCRYIERIANPSRLSAPLQVNVRLNWERVADSVALLGVSSSRFRAAALAKM